jgi:hypothetical protein
VCCGVPMARPPAVRGACDVARLQNPVEVEFEEAGGYPGFSFSAAEAGGSFFRYLVGISYAADVKLPWWPNDAGAIAPFEGGDATHGSRGDWRPRLRRPVADRRREDDFRQRNWVEFRFIV